MEEWKIIEEYPGYQVSNLGEVRSCLNKQHHITSTFRMLRKRIDHNGYYFVNLYGEHHKMKSIKVHRLVAKAFLPNPMGLPSVNHKDENKLNNSVSNLEWCSYKYNVNYGTGHQKSCLSRRHCHTRSILQYTLDGQFVQRFYSLSEASRVLGISLGSISDCLSGRTSKSRNFIFRYE